MCEILNKLRTNRIVLRKKQANALSLILDGKSLFLTGPGGVGKTAVLKAFVANATSKKIAVTSTTGTSAILLNGTTLHSFLGIGLGRESRSALVRRIKSMNWLNNRWCSLECLIIDEISMMRPELFDKLEYVARIVRNNPEPFGGVQLVLSGDYLQLPCIGTMDFCFQAKSWNACVPNIIYLSEVIRQGGDLLFQKCLEQVRVGNVTNEVKDILDSRVGASLINRHGIRPTKLYAKNVDVNKENDLELNKLADDGREFYAYEMTFETPLHLFKRRSFLIDKMTKRCPVNARIEICVGAQVMLAKNIDLPAGLANGSRGIVTGFLSNMPIVQFLNGERRTILIEEWDMEERGQRVARAYQIPLRVAYAISIHRSQGGSLDYAEIDLSEVFEYGQAYVALSRVKSLKGLSIIGIDYDCIQADPIAVQYYEKIRSKETQLKIQQKNESQTNDHV